jgi:hypothetical protein
MADSGVRINLCCRSFYIRYHTVLLKEVFTCDSQTEEPLPVASKCIESQTFRRQVRSDAYGSEFVSFAGAFDFKN